ncbi:uncharacterized protein LOC115875385 isoform X2 [Sitophilus oryzae]|uniref:Uncharacterized protein LOC115875385 isoform X2 n=1 Tax=Sitophilus oryzae TaxID=7048 RepID=A0A6J2X6P4_SITOR|nr:uncharacterized protein LOC115875385 isoform X2 [Sitophilus oryzae]
MSLHIEYLTIENDEIKCSDSIDSDDHSRGSKSAECSIASVLSKDNPTENDKDSTVRNEKELFLHELNLFQDSLFDNRDLTLMKNGDRPEISEDIKIDPPSMIFTGAYDGKAFHQDLTISNCGKKSVFIKIMPPSSPAIKIQPILIARRLSPGLNVVKKVKYLHTKPMAIPQVTMDIYINNQRIQYEFSILFFSFTLYPKVEISPKILNLGEIDVGSVSAMKKVFIKNVGTKQSKFMVDLGKDELELIVQPTKGIVSPGETKEITVEVFRDVPGEFCQEFWIKTDPLQSIKVLGKFIEPMLTVVYPFSGNDLAILVYPSTFLGTTRHRNLIIRNHSSFPAVFCISKKINGTTFEKVPFDTNRESEENYKHFEIYPLEAKLSSDERCLIEIKYSPKMSSGPASYHMGMVFIDFIKCQTISEHKTEISFAEDKEGEDNMSDISILSMDEKDVPELEINTKVNRSISMYLYGETEVPNVILIPHKIYLERLTIKNTYTQPVQVTNDSEKMSLIFRYKKSACIEFEPEELLLPPKEPQHLTLKVRPTKLGHETSQVKFDLLYRESSGLKHVGQVSMNVSYYAENSPNDKFSRKRKEYFLSGITPEITNEVGYLTDDVRFNTKIDKPVQAIVDKRYLESEKDNDALIALPNDRQRTLRPWRNKIPCKTIFTKLPRLITTFDKDYDLHPNRKILKDTTQSYYNSYIHAMCLKRSHGKTLDEECSDYDTSNPNLALMEGTKFKGLKPFDIYDGHKKALFVPLTPYEIYNIVVTPTFIQLGLLGANTTCSDHFMLENRNRFPIHVSVSALYPSIEIIEKEFVLKPASTETVNFMYHTPSGGKHHNRLSINLNFFYCFDVTVLAKIAANTVRCLTKEISIIPADKVAFLELRNPINNDVKFEIDTDFYHLETFPSKGVIPAKRNLACAITLNPEMGFVAMKEIVLISESGAKEFIEVHFEKKKVEIGLSADKIVFDDIPLNTKVTKFLAVQNNSEQLVSASFSLENSDMYPEIVIEPTTAVIWQKSFIVLTIKATFTEMVKFNATLSVVFQDDVSRKVSITGNVAFPEIHFSTSFIKLSKIPSGALLRSPFRIQNKSQVENYVTFFLQDYPEFTVKMKHGKEIKTLYLKANEKRDLVLEFYPKEPVAYCIYLPYVLNGILGPAELNRPTSIKCSEYLRTSNTSSLRIGIPAPSKLNTVKLLCAAGRNWLSFNTLSMTFSNFEELSNIFKITNNTSEILEIFFKIKQTEAFVITPEAPEDFESIEHIEVPIEPEQTVSFKVKFISDAVGNFVEEIPIYVSTYSAVTPYNYLKLTGNYQKASISIDKKIIYLPPVNLSIALSKTIELKLIGHKCEANINYVCEAESISVSFKKCENISPIEIDAYYKISFCSAENCQVEATISFTCPCEASAELVVNARADNSLLINYMSNSTYLKQSTYPYFPNNSDQSAYGTLMHSTVQVIERWLFSQGFYYRQYYTIPDGISRYPVDTHAGGKKSFGGKKNRQPLPLVQLLVNLIDSSVIKYIDNGIAPSEDPVKLATYNYTTYRNTISFLKSQNIFVPGLRPEHLMQYSEYLIFKEELIDKERGVIEESFSELQFYAFSKQKWLDLTLVIIKVLVLERMISVSSCLEKNLIQNEYILKENENILNYYNKHCQRFPKKFECESKLLLWTEYHYYQQRYILWPDQKFKKYQSVTSFKDFYDSFLFVTLTAAYCPYVKSKLQDIYAVPKSEEHLIHNACRLVQTWRSLKFSIDVFPQSIVSGNEVKILLIVMYLYTVLPSYYPTSEVTIETPLSEHGKCTLDVQNCGNSPIQYKAAFFGNESNLFDLDNYEITIQNGKSKKLGLRYFARSVFQVSSILVLSGESSGLNYAKSLVFSVNGVTNISDCDLIKVQVPIYEKVKKKFPIKTPYGKNYKAQLFMCFGKINTKEDLISISDLKSRQLLREYTMDQTECEFQDKGESSVVINFCFLSQGEKSFYVFFCHEEIGDFCVLFKTSSTLKTNSVADSIPVELSENFAKPCICKTSTNTKCPKTFKVDIPCRNERFCKSINTMIQMCFTTIIFNHLETFSDSAFIVRFLKYHAENSPNGSLLPSDVFESSAEFDITRSKSMSSSTKSIFVKNVISKDTISLVFHWDVPQNPSVENLELKKTNGKEVRYFKLVFPKLEDEVSGKTYSMKSSQGGISGESKLNKNKNESV